MTYLHCGFLLSVILPSARYPLPLHIVVCKIMSCIYIPQVKIKTDVQTKTDNVCFWSCALLFCFIGRIVLLNIVVLNIILENKCIHGDSELILYLKYSLLLYNR